MQSQLEWSGDVGEEMPGEASRRIGNGGGRLRPFRKKAMGYLRQQSGAVIGFWSLVEMITSTTPRPTEGRKRRRSSLGN